VTIILLLNRSLVEWKGVADQMWVEEDRVRLGESGEFTHRRGSFRSPRRRGSHYRELKLDHWLVRGETLWVGVSYNIISAQTARRRTDGRRLM